LKSVILNIGFWAAITQLLELLEPIHTLQKMSEDNHATISYVYPRWTQLESHLKKIANSNSLFAADVKAYLETKPVDGIKLNKIDKRNWTRRRQKQLLPIHRVAYFLDPLNSKAKISEIELAEVEKFIKQRIPDYQCAFEQFFDFRNHEGSFANTAIAWGYSKQPKMFWNCAEPSSPALSSFAKRLLTTIGNSVPSERAFSAMNYIHSKIRNRLSVERADKLQYIFMNSRTLAKQRIKEPTTEELLEMEELYVAGHKAGQGI
jgi:hAT family C-terminal dimerisation region